jgi:hypothetical protein
MCCVWFDVPFKASNEGAAGLKMFRGMRSKGGGRGGMRWMGRWRGQAYRFCNEAAIVKVKYLKT